ncbi:SMI1/KNR4 family protein [Streptomyces sp. NPDC004327]|uniref:SMI1/KNR4 family protein n=1 Tax=Streptomyces sp. NPDC004327 TaxID=3364699 RepID=UPI0036BA4B11
MNADGPARLRALLGEPETWGWARPSLWQAAEAHLGLSLPSDYKTFLDLYGPGALDGVLHLERPVHGTPEEAQDLWPPHPAQSPGTDPWPHHPEPGGLLAWGHDEHGNTYYFLPLEPDPDDWRIVVHTESADWFETGGTFTDFLLRCHDGIDLPPGLPRGWPTCYDQRPPDTW